MVLFEIPMELYYWMIDKADINDDQRNTVDIKAQTVALSTDHHSKLESGFFIGKLMHSIRRTILKLSKKPFTLDPVLNNLKDMNTLSSREYNWGYIFTELKRFGVKVLSTVKSEITRDCKDDEQKKQKEAHIKSILEQLFNYDQQLLVQKATDHIDSTLINNTSPDQQFQPYQNSPTRNPSIKKSALGTTNSELNFGLSKSKLEAIEKKLPKPLETQSHSGDNQILILNQDSPNGYFKRQVKGSKSQSLKPEQKQLIQLQQTRIAEQSEMNLPLGDHAKFKYLEREDVITNVDDFNTSELPSALKQSGKEEISQREGNIQDSESIVMFIVNSLKISLNLRHNQVGALLANKNKYLILTCIKGTKEDKYQKVVDWYQTLVQNVSHLVNLLVNDQDQIKQSMNVLRSGLFSKHLLIVELTFKLLSKILITLNDHTPKMVDTKFQIMSWLVNTQTDVPRIQSPVRRSQSLSAGKQNKKGDVDSFLNESGLFTMVRAYNKHQDGIIEDFSQFLVVAGKDNYLDMLTNHFRLICRSNSDYLSKILDIFKVLIGTQSGKEVFIDSGVMSMILDLSLQLANNLTSQYLPINDNSQHQSQIKSENMLALNVLVTIWCMRPDFIQSNRLGSQTLADAVIYTLKKTCRDRSKLLSSHSTALLMHLLDYFGRNRNSYAPIIYKTLTFVLVDVFQNTDLRHEILCGFINLFRQNTSIPISILCEPFLKQIQLGLKKEENLRLPSSILQPQIETMNLNVVDFEFFMIAAVHPKLQYPIAIQLLEIGLEVSKTYLIFTRISLKLVLTILSRFENNVQIFEWLQEYIRNQINLIFDQDQKKLQILLDLIKNQKLKNQIIKSQGNHIVQFLNQLESLNSSSPSKKQIGRVGNRLDPYVSDKSPQKGILIQNKPGTESYVSDDGELKQLMNPNVNPEQSGQFMQLKTTEKMVVNQLQCIIGSGVKVLVDFIRQQLVEIYIKIEIKLKLRNNAVLFLLNLVEKDPPKIIQFHYQEQLRIKAERAKERQRLLKEQLDYQNSIDLDQSISLNENDPIQLNPLEKRLLQRNSPLKAVSSTPYLQKSLQTLEIHPKFQVNKSKEFKSNLFEEVQFEKQSVKYPFLSQERRSIKLPKISHDRSQALLQYNQLDQNSSINERYHSPPTRKLGEPVSVRALTVGKSKQGPEVKLYDISKYDQEEETYAVWVLQHIKLYKAMFHKYANLNSVRKTLQKKPTFEEMEKQKQIMSLPEVFAFLNDFQIIQNFPYVKRDNVVRIIKLINIQNQTELTTQTQLTLQGFVDFVLQIAHILHEKLDLASIFVPLFFNYMKEVALNSDKPLFQRLFEDPQTSSFGDKQLLSELTQKVNQDPDFVLPPGFVKVPSFNITYVHQAPEYLKESERISKEIIDNLVFSLFGFHTILPRAKHEPKTIVKPDIYNNQLKNNLSANYLQISDKYKFKSRLVDKYPTKYTDFAEDNIKQRAKQTGSINETGKDFQLLKSARKSPIKMVSSLEPEIDVFLKLQIANNKDPSLREYLKEAAFLMDDMLKAVENGRTSLSPRAKERIYRERGGRKLRNQVIVDKQEMEELEKEEKKQKQEEWERRQAKLKKKLEEYAVTKEIVKQYDMVKLEEEERKKKEEEQRKKNEKLEYYNKLHKEFEETRLPQIQAINKAEDENRKKQKEERKRQKKEAEQKIQKNTEDMITLFKIKRLERDIADKEKKKKQEKDKNIQSLKRDTLAISYMRRKGILDEDLERDFVSPRLSLNSQIPLFKPTTNNSQPSQQTNSTLPQKLSHPSQQQQQSNQSNQSQSYLPSQQSQPSQSLQQSQQSQPYPPHQQQYPSQQNSQSQPSNQINSNKPNQFQQPVPQPNAQSPPKPPEKKKLFGLF